MKPILVMWSIVVIFLVACDALVYQTPAPPTLTRTPTISVEQVDLEKRKWDGLGIRNYHIIIKFDENFAAGLRTKRDVTVRDNRVVSSSCEDNKCPAFVFTDVYTVDDLFKIARGSTIAWIGEEYAYCIQGIAFDQTYGFPSSMDVDCPRDADEEHSFEVISFEELK